MYDIELNKVRAVTVKFSQPMQYMIGGCTAYSYKVLPVQPPVEVDRIWKITKTETALIITCNDVEVLNFLFADSSNSVCQTLEGDVVDHIEFVYGTGSITVGDTASDFYNKAAPTACPAFAVPESTQGSWDATEPGTNITISCNRRHVLIGGDAEISCQGDGTWNTSVDDLKCKHLSKLSRVKL
eukprot:sb/3471452/